MILLTWSRMGKKTFVEREKKMKNLVSFLKDERGLETVEWAVIAALIVAALVGVIQLLGTNVLAKFTALEDATD